MSDRSIGWWKPAVSAPVTGDEALCRAIHALDRPIFVVDVDGVPAVSTSGIAILGDEPPTEADGSRLRAYVPAILPGDLGDCEFRADHGLYFAYVAGEMANGIASVELVQAMAAAGMLGFFGAAGLEPEEIEAAIRRLQARPTLARCGFNLIHSPGEPALENATVDLYLKHGVRLVSASAYLDLTLPLVRYRVAGITGGADGRVVARNHVVAKISRVEVATKFLSPPPAEMLRQLVVTKVITEAQAQLAATIPMADDLTAEADSGGHTDNRPLVTLLPTIIALRDRISAKFGYQRVPRVGAAGGIATPEAVAGAFSMGAAFVMTGSINQACVEAGTSTIVKQMLAEAGQADVTMAPAADMFEMGVKVQVLKRGTMFALRARKLYDLYRAYDRVEDIPAAERTVLERDFFRTSLEQAWESTRAYFATRDPTQNERADRDAKHKLALIFRAYLGQSSMWANRGDVSRKVDYQVWCGPAMGAFNEWTRGTIFGEPARREAAAVALNLMFGAAALTRANSLRTQGVWLPPAATRIEPRPAEELCAVLSTAKNSSRMVE